jgi:hypothetical protein
MPKQNKRRAAQHAKSAVKERKGRESSNFAQFQMFSQYEYQKFLPPASAKETVITIIMHLKLRNVSLLNVMC